MRRCRKLKMLFAALLASVSVSAAIAGDIVVGENDGNVFNLRNSDLKTMTQTNIYGPITILDVQPGTDDVLIARNDGVILLTDGNTLMRKSQAQIYANNIGGFQPNGNVVVGTDTSQGVFQQYSGTDLAVLKTDSIYSNVTAIGFLPNNSFALGGANGIIRFYDSSVQLIQNINLWGKITGLGVESNGKFVAARSDGYMALINGTDGSQSANTNLYREVKLLVNPTNNNIVAAGLDGYIFLRSGADLSAIGMTNIYSPLVAAGMLPNGNFVVARNDGLLFLVNGNDLTWTTKSGFGNVTCIAGKDDYVVVGNDTGDVYKLSASDLSQLAYCKLSSKINKIAFRTADSRAVALADIKKIPDGTQVAFGGMKVTAILGNYLYVEDLNRASGIRVYQPGNYVGVGNIVYVNGAMSTEDSGERFIDTTADGTVTGYSSSLLTPLEVTNKSLGGGSTNGQPGIDGANGMNNIGLYIKTTGKVVGTVGTDNFNISDGSGVEVKVLDTTGTITMPWPDDNVIVTGISSCEKVDGVVKRVILATKLETVN